MPAPIQAPYNADEEPLPIMNGPMPADGYQAGDIGMAIADVPGSTGTPAPTNDLARFAPPAGSTAPNKIKFPSREEFDKMPRVQQEYWVSMKQVVRSAQAGNVRADAVEQQIAKLNMDLFNAQQNMKPPQIVNRTNPETGMVTQWAIHPSKPPELLKPETIHTTAGVTTRMSPTLGAVMTNAQGQPLQGYASSGGLADILKDAFGNSPMRTNAPVQPVNVGAQPAFVDPAPQPTPAPAATPVQQANAPTPVTAGQMPKFNTQDEVRAAVKSGALSREQGLEVLRSQFGLK